MRYLLALYMNPTIWESLSDEQRNGVYQGHEAFQQAIKASGEMVGTEAFAEPSAGATVRVRGGKTEAASGLFQAGEAFCCGYYLVECASLERAIEVAALIPDAQYTAVEVRPLLQME